MSFEYNNIKYIKLSFIANLMSKIKNCLFGKKTCAIHVSHVLEIRDRNGHGTVAPVISVLRLVYKSILHGYYMNYIYLILTYII